MRADSAAGYPAPQTDARYRHLREHGIERIRKKLKALSVRLAAMRTHGGKAMVAYVRRHLQGHIQYFGVSGNSRSLQEYVYQAGGCCSNG